MKAFELSIPETSLNWAKQEAARIGGRLIADEQDGCFVLMAPRLPASLAPFERAVASGHAAKEKPVPQKSNDDEAETVWALAVPFDQRKSAQSLGARWSAPAKAWVFKGARLPEGLRPFQAQAWSWEAAIQRALRDERPRAWAASGEPMDPRPHQLVAAQTALSAAKAGYPAFLIADEVGLGKTISAWEAAQWIGEWLKAKSVLIVSPLSVMAHWRQTLARRGSKIEDALIINYDRLQKLFEMPEGVKAKSKKGLARRGQAPELDIIIFDESHKLKNPTAARSKLAAKLAANAKFCLYLSATAGQNPLELSYLAALIAKATGSSARSLKDYEGWCQAQGFGLKQGKFGAWEWSGEQKDCDRLREMLYEGKIPAGIRRRPQNIQGWPEISRALMPQPLDEEQRALYQSSWNEFKAWAKGRRAELKGGKSKAKGMAALVEALRFRQKSSQLRWDQTVEMALDLLEDGVKPAISCAFKSTASALKEKLEKKGVKCSLIEGGMSAEQREEQRVDFQKNKTECMIFTIEEGISLHEGELMKKDRPRALLIHDLRWSAIQMAQIEGRCHRDGKFAQAYWLAGEGTIEMRVAKRVAEKTVAMKALSGDADAGLDEELLRLIEQHEE